MRLRRRTLAKTIIAATVPGLAGCADSLTDDGDEATPTADPTATETETTTATETETPAETETETEPTEDEPDRREPESVEDAARLLVDDLAAEQFERAAERAAPDASVLTPAVFERYWLGYTAVGGAFREIIDVEAVDDAVEVTMAFERGDHHLGVSTDDELRIAGIGVRDEYARPEYVDPDAFEEREVTVPAELCPMDGIATVPNVEEDVPGVVFVHGSQPSNKNAFTGTNKPFKDIAEGLATRGIAALRYNKRTFQCRVDPEDATFDRVTVEDALVAIGRLREVEGVDPDRIVVAGISLGGMAAPRIVERDGALAGGAALAAPARELPEVFLEQDEYLTTVGEHDSERAEAQYRAVQRQAEQIRSGNYEREEILLGHSGWFWDSIEEYDQIGTARRIDEPLFFLQGERDFRVSPERDFERWRSELADRERTAFRLYDGLNHAFLPGDGPAVPEEYLVRNSVDRRVVADLDDWIRGL